MKVLVTGGAGFIGSNFTHLTLAGRPDTEVVVLDSLTYAGNMENLEPAKGNPKFKFVKGDICKKEDVERAAAGIDLIVNFAAESHVDYSLTNPKAFFDTNVLGTLVLLEEARKKDISFVQISTDEVFGAVLKGESKEADALAPSNPYSASKASAELLAQAYVRTYGMDVKVSHTTNNYGPYQHIEKMIPRFIAIAMSGKPITIYGDGKQVREWIHVRDNCEALWHMVDKGKSGESYNIGTGQRKTALEVGKLVLEILGKPSEQMVHQPMRPGEDYRYALDSSKMKALGWKPKIGFEDGMKETIKWYLDNRPWWEAKAKNYDFSVRHTKLPHA